MARDEQARGIMLQTFGEGKVLLKGVFLPQQHPGNV